MFIYKVTNKVNGKIYIGKTTRPLEVRWAQHLLDAQNGSRLRFHRSIRKHGADQFKVEVIHKADSLESLDQLERSSIAEYKSCDRRFGYNLTMGGDGAAPGELNPMFGKTHSDEVKQKLRELRLGTSQSEATRQKISAAVSGVNNPFFGKPTQVLLLKVVAKVG